MPKKKMTLKKLTLRQRLRNDAEAQLDKLVAQAGDAVDQILAGTSLTAWDLMHLASSNQNKSLRAHMVTQLANEKEAELERLYNKQQDLDLGEDDA
jgi:hypothetical protein